ncbi:hypothetical protein [Vibrio harveyi]|uniref:hypothetical protein n=1 Tax=Vibrio harveyi TaxID=669 RepID=UPI003CEFD8E8
MVNLMVLGLLFLAVLSAASFSFMSMTESTQSLIDAQTEKSQIKKIEILVNNYLAPNQSNGKMMAPLGVNLTNDFDGDTVNDTPIHSIPTFFGLNDKNTWGKNYVYCPVGSRESASSNPVIKINLKSDSNSQIEYDARTIELKGKQFVSDSNIALDSSLDNLDIAYILISPFKGKQPLPTCDQVKYEADKNRYTVPNGLAIVATQDKIQNETGYLSKLETASDIDSNDINQHIGSWKTSTTLSYKMNLPAKDFIADKNVDFCLEDDTYRRNIVIQGNYDSGSVTKLDAKLNVVEFCNVDVTIKDLALSNVTVKGTNINLTIDNVAIEGLTLTNSNVDLKNTVIFDFNKAGDSLSLINSEASLISGNYTFKLEDTTDSQVSLENSKLFIKAANVSFETPNFSENNSSIINVDSLSKIALVDTILSASVKASNIIEAYGPISISGGSFTSTVSSTDGIKVSPGGTVTLIKNAKVNTKSAIGIIDNGGAGFYGKSATINSHICWSGLAFSDTADNNSGNSESLGLQSQVNRSSWTCNP